MCIRHCKSQKTCGSVILPGLYACFSVCKRKMIWKVPSLPFTYLLSDFVASGTIYHYYNGGRLTSVCDGNSEELSTVEGLVIPSAPEWCHHIHNIKINIIKMLIKFFTRVPVVKLLYYNCHKPLFGSWSRHFSEFCGGWVLVQLKIFIICPPTPSLRLTFAEGSTLIGPDLTKNWALIGGTSLCKMYKNLCIKNYVLATRDILSLSLWQWKNIFYISSHQDTV